MMIFFRITHIKKAILLLIGLQILNSSIDAPDVLPEWIPENLSYNEIESVTEWLVEIVFTNKNKLQEFDDQDDNKKKNQLKKDKDYYHNQSNTFSFLIGGNYSLQYSEDEAYLNITGNIHSPPPELNI